MPLTDLQYVLTADYHEGDFFAIKFYAKMHRKSDFKYSLITNKGDVGKASKKLEDYSNTQRFRVYREFVMAKIGADIFKHYEYEDISGYLLVNRHCGMNIDAKERELVTMLAETYNDLPNP